jgi:hypothetical protein
MSHRNPRFVLATLALLVIAPVSLLHCGADGAGADDGATEDGGDEGGDDDGDLEVGREVEALCERFFESYCDYASDCAGVDEDECLDRGDYVCGEAVDASEREVDLCVEALDRGECDDPMPRACKDPVTLPDDFEPRGRDEEDAEGGEGVCPGIASDTNACGDDCRPFLLEQGAPVYCAQDCSHGEACSDGTECLGTDDIKVCVYTCAADPCPEGMYCHDGGLCLAE